MSIIKCRVNFSGEKMKKIIVLVFFFISISYSQTGYMTIEKKDGTSVLYLLPSVRQIRFSTIISDVNSKNLAAKVIHSFQLYQNYPNPFNPSTIIEYDIPKTGMVEINIYNIQGRLVKKLDNSVHQSGSQKVVWDGRDNIGAKVASGVYFYQVRYSGNTITKKLMLIK
jgi:hypothetical protein